MRRLLLVSLVIAIAAPALAAPSAAAAADDAPVAGAPRAALQEGGSDSGLTDVVLVATWTFVAIVAGSLLLGALYFFKKQVGGFPENPSWVAPISIERSETFADEGDFGDAVPDAHGAHH